MKNLFVLFTFFQLFLNSQTNNGWSVVEKNNVYTNCLFFAEKHYSERFNIDDFPEICACVLKNTIQTFKEEDYKSQIVIEVNKFQDNMFVIEDKQRAFVLKPMNCPCHIQIFNKYTVNSCR